MENLILLLTASLVLYKPNKRFKRVFIGNTSCSLLYAPDAEFDFYISDDDDELYFAEHTDKGIAYGVLCARLHESLPLEEAGEVMTSYLGRLRRPFNALHNTGIMPCPSWTRTGEGTRLEDYWQDEDGFDWKVKAYTDGHTIAVLYVKNIAEGETARHDEFLNSFSF